MPNGNTYVRRLLCVRAGGKEDPVDGQGQAQGPGESEMGSLPTGCTPELGEDVWRAQLRCTATLS
jgi:hypothetical protein